MLSPRKLGIMLIAFAAVAGAQLAEPFRISVNVDLVVLNVTARDHEGRVVSDLRQQDFEIRDGGALQSMRVFKHEDMPVIVGLVVDHSGSMRRKMPDVIAAVRTFVQSSRPDDEMFVVNFNESVTLGLPDAVRLSNRPEELALAISNTPADGETALYDAIFKAQERLQASTREKKVLFVISDGGDNASTHTLAEVLKTAGQSSTMVYTIGLFDDEDPDRNPAVLTRLAVETGGEAFFPAQVGDVVSICERVARDIRSQYTLGYVPTNPAKPGHYRRIQVTARSGSHPKLFVRTRAGYIGGGLK
jgi:Ca-activated chloride channel family protein